VSIDLRGHGESDKPNEPYTIGAYADLAVGRIPSALCGGHRHG